jgi:hypothetical protein
MQRPSPMQVVKKNFQGRAQLAEQLAPIVDKTNGDTTDAEVKSRLMRLSNAKLLRLWRVEQTVRERFGDRARLVQHLVDARKKAGLTADAAYVAKLGTFTKARLLDLTREKHDAAPAKQTPEQKLKAKRGRKARARALSKLGK